MTELLALHNLTVSFPAADKPFNAVREVSLSLTEGSVLALVGESGSGKSMTALSIMRLVPPPGVICTGSIMFKGDNLLTLPEENMRSIRGRHTAMIFQDPMTSLNPVLTIGEQLREPLQVHLGLSRHDAHQQSIELLSSVGIASAATRMSDYPHQLSGGMRQRVMIAMALSCRPALLIADEPTTALDVTIQAQILELLTEQKQSRGLSLLLITHDLGIVAERADHTAVMYAGQIVESAPTAELLADPRHPYTISLLAALPQHATPGVPLPTLTQHVGTPATDSAGCSFAGRCPHADDTCRTQAQQLQQLSPSHLVRCCKCH